MKLKFNWILVRCMPFHGHRQRSSCEDEEWGRFRFFCTLWPMGKTTGFSNGRLCGGDSAHRWAFAWFRCFDFPQLQSLQTFIHFVLGKLTQIECAGMWEWFGCKLNRLMFAPALPTVLIIIIARWEHTFVCIQCSMNWTRANSRTFAIMKIILVF